MEFALFTLSKRTIFAVRFSCLIAILFCAFPLATLSQSLPNPFSFPILLSGNFGELRSNHFHAGIDFKTQGVVNKPIHAIMDGYVSRISVSPWGYGNALYVDHPNGQTTVYAHLHRFTSDVNLYIKEQQYEQEQYAVNLYPEKNQFVFHLGDTIAWAGNTGSSAGPHLHFEIRDTKTEEILDPLPYFKEQIKDTRPPRINGVAIYPQAEKGVVNGKSSKQMLKITRNKNGKTSVTSKINAWGELGLGINAYDFMTGTNNIYGVKKVELLLDDEVIFSSNIERYAFSETRYLNSFTDYDWWINKKTFYMKSFVEPGNRLRFISAKNRGIIEIDEERAYHLQYSLTDLYGNNTKLDLVINGVKQDIPKNNTEGTVKFSWNKNNSYENKGLNLKIDKGNLYTNLDFVCKMKEDTAAFSHTYQLHNSTIPIHKSAELAIEIQKDSLRETRHYGIVSTFKGKNAWIGGEYRNGWIETSIRDLGKSYTIMADTKAPKASPIAQNTWTNKGVISFKLSDDLSGVESYRAKIDGEFVLFEMNNRQTITCKIDKARFKPGKHKLTLSVFDACENEYLQEFNLIIK